MADLEEEAGLTAMALVRAAAERRHDGDDYDPGQVVEDYLQRAWQAAGSPEDGMNVTEPLGLLISALCVLGGAALQVSLANATGRRPEDVPDDELLARLDALELEFMAGGGFRG